MPTPSLTLATIAVTAITVVAPATAGRLSDPPQPEATTMTIRGPFDVTMTPQTNTDAEGPVPARMVLDKRYHGVLDATARGQMIAHRTGTPGSAVYVAMELVDGTLAGRRGTFVLHHRGVMDRGTQSLSIEVVPDSGTGELVGITGTMTIEIEAGKHFYGFTYQLPAHPSEVPSGR